MGREVGRKTLIKYVRRVPHSERVDVDGQLAQKMTPCFIDFPLHVHPMFVLCVQTHVHLIQSARLDIEVHMNSGIIRIMGDVWKMWLIGVK